MLAIIIRDIIIRVSFLFAKSVGNVVTECAFERAVLQAQLEF